MQLNNSAFASICKAGFVGLATVLLACPFLSLQDDGPQDTSDPFSDFVEEETTDSEADPFSDFVEEETTTVQANSVPKEPQQQQFGNNDLRDDEDSGQGLVPAHQIPPLPATHPRDSQAIPLRQIPAAPQYGDVQEQPVANHPPVYQVHQAPRFAPLRAKPSAQEPVQQPMQRPMRRSMQESPVVASQDIIIDPNLQPTTYTEPIERVAPPVTRTAPAPRRTSPNIILAGNLLKELAKAEMESASSGQPMGLLDMMVNCDSSQRKKLIRQYWSTYAAWAQYRFAIDELNWLQQVGQVQSQAERAALDAAQSAANDAVTARSLELTKQQHLLNKFLMGPRSETLPLPSDKPLLTRYRTNYDLYASQRSMPENLKMIHQWLPEQQQLIGDRASTVQRCRNAVMVTSRSVSQGQSAATLMQNIELCRKCHSRFIETVVEYNKQIAEYALTLKPYSGSPEKVVAMLIPVNASNTSVPNYNNQSRQATLQGTPYDSAARADRTRGSQNRLGDQNRQSGQMMDQQNPFGNGAMQPAAPDMSRPAQPGQSGGFGNNGLVPRRSGGLPGQQRPAASQQPAINQGGFRPPSAPPSQAGGGFRR